MFCVVSNDLMSFQRRYDAQQDRSDWLSNQANNDDFSAYMEDALEQMTEQELSDADYQHLIDTGEYQGLSDEGKEAVKARAMDLAIEDGFSRYDEE